jgi:hypothetical protein
MLLKWVGSLFRKLSGYMRKTPQDCSESGSDGWPEKPAGRRLHVYIPGEGLLTLEPNEYEDAHDSDDQAE